MLLIYCFSLFFTYYLFNYAEITRAPASWIKGLLGAKLSYPIACSFCSAFWSTLALYILGWVPGFWVLVAPVIHLFIDLVYQKLSGNCPPCIGGNK